MPALISLDNDSSSEFYANFIVHVLTLKGLIETDTLYLVFKDPIPIVIGLPDGQLELALSKRGV